MLKQIRDQTGVRVDIPRREALIPSANGNGTPLRTSPAPLDDDEEDVPMVPITISGPQPMVLEARELMNNIISTRTANSTQRVRDIPEHVLPFVITRRAQFLAAAGEADVLLTLKRPERLIVVQGPRIAVGQVAETIKSTIAYFNAELTSFPTSLPKRMHRLLLGAEASDQIMSKSKCSITIPPHDDPSEEITIWGLPNDISGGLGAVMQRANSQYIHELPLPGPVSFSKQILAYMDQTAYISKLSGNHPGIQVYTPSANALATAQILNIDIVGEKGDVDKAVEELSEFIGTLLGGTRSVDADWLVHAVVQAKNSEK